MIGNLMNRHRIGKGYYAFESTFLRPGTEERGGVAKAFDAAFSFPAEELNVVISQREPATGLDPQLLADELAELTTAQLLRLKRYAQWRMRGLGRKAAGRSYEDLISEALTATICGDRTRRENLDLCQHLLGAMRSISSRWHEKRQLDIYLESELEDPDERSVARGSEHAITDLDPERILAGKELLANIRKLFSKDPIALNVLDLLALGYTETEIRGQVQISKCQYGAATKRIRRILAARY